MVVIRTFCCTLICFLFLTTIYAKQENPFLHPKKSRSGVDILYNHAWDIVAEQPDSSVFYAELQEQLARDIDYPLGRVNAHYIKGYAYAKMNYFDRAATEYHMGLNIILDNNGYEYLRKKVLLLKMLGIAYESTYGYDEALKHYEEAMAIARSINYTSNIANLHYNIGVIYRLTNRPDLAKKHYYQALKLYKEENDVERIAMVYNLLGIWYNHASQYDIARQYLQLALNLSDQHPDQLQSKKTWFLNNIGENYLKRGNLEKAKGYYLQALDISKQLKTPYEIKYYCNNLGDLYQQQGHYNQALAYYKQALEYVDTDTDAIDDEYRRTCESISDVYEHLDQLKEALQYKNELLAQSSLLAETKEELNQQNSVYRMKEVQWMLERQAQKAQLLTAQSENFWFKFSISLLFIVLVYAGYQAVRYYRGIRAVKKWLATE